MNSIPHVFGRSVLVIAIVVLALPTGLRAQVGDFSVRGAGSTTSPVDPEPTLGVTDDPDPYGNRYGTYPGQPRYILWDGSRLRVLPISIVVDPVSGAVVAFEPVVRDEEALGLKKPRNGADGYVRITLPISWARRY